MARRKHRVYLPLVSGAPKEAQKPPPTLLVSAVEVGWLVIKHPEQKRDKCMWSDVLATVARNKASDMAEKNYYSHTDLNGHGANWWIKRAGYKLPDWYHQDDAANNCESINMVKGDPTDDADDAPEVFNSWLNSPPHRKQILGLTDFYAEQTHFGVGCARTQDKMTVYWVFLSAPPPES